MSVVATDTADGVAVKRVRRGAVTTVTETRGDVTVSVARLDGADFYLATVEISVEVAAVDGSDDVDALAFARWRAREVLTAPSPPGRGKGSPNRRTALTCEQCDATFEAGRCNARFCSGRCRVAAHRAGLPPRRQRSLPRGVVDVDRQLGG